MARGKPIADPSRPGAPPWRAIRRGWPHPLGWAYAGLAFWCGLVLLRLAPGLDLLVLPLALVASAALVGATYFLYREVVARGLARLRAPVPVPPPPQTGKADLAYVVPPRPVYPAIQLHRGQCGWVRLRLRVDRTGRISAYRIIEQAPGRAFEAAVVQALAAARLPPGDVGEASCVFAFAAPGPHAPEWARSRLPSARVVR